MAMIYLLPGYLRKYSIVLAILGATGLIRMAPENFWERIDTIFVSAKTGDAVDRSSETRIQLLSAQWEMFLDHPAGSGHRGTAFLSPNYLSEEFLSHSQPGTNGQIARSSHNTFMTALSEQGVPGAVIYASLLLWIFRTSRQVKQSASQPEWRDLQVYSVAVAASLVAITVAGLFTDYFKTEIFVWCLVVLAVLARLAGETTPARESATDAATIDRTRTA
jgi:O-antigen ligase